MGANRTVLIVDRDTALRDQLTASAASISVPYVFLHAATTEEAIESVRKNEVDALVAELRLSQHNGLELLSWMTRHQPQVVAFAMSSKASVEEEAELAELVIERFVRPLKAAAMLRVLTQRVRSSVRGQFQNITLTSILQILEAERATCLLRVTSGEQSGQLGIVRGELTFAMSPSAVGDEAAITIIGWQDARVDALSRRSREHNVSASTRFLIMEAMRRLDEEGVVMVGDESDVFLAISEVPTGVRDLVDSIVQTTDYGSAEDPDNEPDHENKSRPSVNEPTARVIEKRESPMTSEQELITVLRDIEGATGGFIAASVVDLGSGMPLATHSARSDFDLAAASAYNSELVKQKLQIMRTLGLEGHIHDMIITLDTQIHIIKMVSSQSFLYLAVAKANTNLAIIRMAVERHAHRLV